MTNAVDNQAFLRALRIAVLCFAAFLTWPIVYDLAQDWWVRSTVYPYGIVFIAVALIFAILRRKDRPVAEPDGRGLVVLFVACCGLIAGRWAAEFVASRISVWLMVVSFVWIFSGFPMVRHFAGPLVLDLTSIPPPQVIFNIVAAPFLKFFASLTAAICAFAGITVFEDGAMMYTVDFQFGVPDAASTIRNFPGLCVVAYLFARHYCGPRIWSFRHWKVWLSIVVIPALVCCMLVLVRMTLSLYLADRNDWSDWAPIVYRSIAGIPASIAAVVVVWFSQWLFWRNTGSR